MFAFLGAHRGELFPDEDYADLFLAGGRPWLPATRMAAVLTLQALHGLSERECAEAVRCDLRWKVACGSSLLDEGFDPSTLVYWRRRIARSTRPHRVNEAIGQVVEETGVCREVPGGAEVVARVCTGHDYSCVGKPRIDWTDPAGKDGLVSALVVDANAVLAALAEVELEEPAASAPALSALVAGQDVEPAEGSDGTDGRWRIARRSPRTG